MEWTGGRKIRWERAVFVIHDQIFRYRIVWGHKMSIFRHQFLWTDSIVCCPFHTSPQPSATLANTNHSDTRIPCDDIKLFYFINFLSSIFVRINVLADMKHVMVWNGFPTEQNIIQIKNKFYNNSKPLNSAQMNDICVFVCAFSSFRSGGKICSLSFWYSYERPTTKFYVKNVIGVFQTTVWIRTEKNNEREKRFELILEPLCE